MQVKIRMVLDQEHSIWLDHASRYLLGCLTMAISVSPVMKPVMVCSSHLCH